MPRQIPRCWTRPRIASSYPHEEWRRWPSDTNRWPWSASPRADLPPSACRPPCPTGGGPARVTQQSK
eukprot:5718100-Prymnesium_polylepis.1